MPTNKYQLARLGIMTQARLPILIKDVRYSKALKNYECVSCGNEIVKGDLYYSYKPLFENRKRRCINCKPKIYNDYERYDI